MNRSEELIACLEAELEGRDYLIGNLRAELAALREQVPVAKVLSEHEMGIGFDRRYGPVIWFNGYPPAGNLYAAPVAKQVVIPDVRVSAEGIQFGKAWFSHEAITGYTAEQLNSGNCRITGRAYMDWVNARLNAADQEGGV